VFRSAFSKDEDFGEPHSLALEAGDVLLLVTDGFYEWTRAADGELYGTRRLIDSLHRHAATPAATIIERLAADVQAFAGDVPQVDDMTAVAIRRRES
jgi:serine phosphatase RsbU (regulator of sigma subunit)